jgi:hypothetical protein
MELIPILSTIILVATISTFILAIGAYILYKVREAKGQQASAPSPSTVRAELLTPAELQMEMHQAEQKIVPQPIYIEPQPVPLYQQKPVYVQQPIQQRASMGPQYAAQPRQYPDSGYSDVKNYPQSKTGSKFLKYTTEGYVIPSKEEKTSGALKWK